MEVVAVPYCIGRTFEQIAMNSVQRQCSTPHMRRNYHYRLPSPSSQWSGCPHSVVPASQGWMDQLQKHLLQLELVKSSQCFSSALDIGQHTCCPRWIRHVCDWLVQLVCGMNGLCIDLIPFVLFYCGQFLNSLYLLFQEKINIRSHST